MANEEHLRILKQGVMIWNQWREENPDIEPDLSKAKIGREFLVSANLSRVNLSGADLIGAELFKANLSEAKLDGAFLVDANLARACLSGAYLIGAKLIDAILFAAILSGAYLRKANLSEADLSEANLCEADLCKASLRNAYLRGAHLSRANLTQSDLRYAQLIKTDFTQATLTGAKLYGTSRDDWITKGIICDYVYWDQEGKQRSPRDRDFAEGEFEQIYATLPIIEYIFQDGMQPIDPLIMDRVVQAIQKKNPKFDLKIDSINARGLAPSIRFTVQQEEYKEAALQEIKNEYENRLARLESDKEHLSRLLSQAIENNRLSQLLLGQAIEKTGDTIFVGNGSNVATRGSEIKTEYRYAIELKELIEKEPEDSKSFLKIAKDKALEIVEGALVLQRYKSSRFSGG